MNKVKSIILATGMMLLLQNCGKDFLDTPVQGEVVVENFYRTEEDAFMALVAAYSALGKADSGTRDPQHTQQGTLHGWANFTFGDICSDDAEKGGGSRNDFVDAADLSEFVASPDLRHIWNVWRDCYLGIALANLVIENVPRIEFAATRSHLKDQYIAEAKFLRAYFYFFLVRIYGGVPIVAKPIGQDEYNKPRSTIAETYSFIQQDLKEAIPHLPLKSQYPAQYMGRITKGAAQGFLAKTLVFESSYAENYPGDNRYQGTTKKWAEALEAAETVINSGQYNLSTPVELIFRLKYENGPESVFEIQFKESGDGWHNDNTGHTAYTMQRCRGTSWPTLGEGWGFNQPTQDLVNAFEHGGDWGGDSLDWLDPRFEATIVYEGKIAFWDSTVVLGVGVNQDRSLTGYLNAKPVISPAEIPLNWSDAGSNQRILRYADVILLAAEAAYHTGNEGKAREYLEMVRARARASSSNSNALPYINTGGTALRDAIWHERRVELAMEGHRFHDLVRQGRAAQVINTYYANSSIYKLSNPFIPGIHELFPIPQMERSVNTSLEQNPGYF
jgi:starch-binding outer membrane protein, SusD/RagB family